MWWVCTTSTASCGTTAGGDMFQEALWMLPASFKVPLRRWARGVVCGCMPAWWCVVELGSVPGVDADILVDHVDFVIVVDNGY